MNYYNTYNPMRSKHNFNFNRTNNFNKGKPKKNNETNKFPLLNVEKILNITSEDYEYFIEQAENWAKNDNSSTNQVRNFYDELICNLDSNDKDIKSKLGKIKIMLAYAKGRKNISYTFFDNLNKLCNYLMNNPEPNKIENFKKFMEAYVAYNKLNIKKDEGD